MCVDEESEEKKTYSRGTRFSNTVVEKMTFLSKKWKNYLYSLMKVWSSS